MTLTIDRERAERLVARLDEAFQAREGLLAEVDDLVENQVPLGVRRGSEPTPDSSSSRSPTITA